MLVQAVARYADDLPITLLELNTITHVVCTLCMYLLWLKKPQDVGTPTTIYDRQEYKPLHTLLCIKEVKSEIPHKPSARHTLGPVLQWKDGVFQHKMKDSGAWVRQWHEPHAPDTAPSVPYTKKGLNQQTLQADYVWIFHSDRTETYISFHDGNFLTHQAAQFLVDFSSGKISTLGGSELNWKEFYEGIESDGRIGCVMEASNIHLRGSIKSYSSNFAGFTAAIVFPAIYGSVHLIPWAAHFPTYLERYLWRSSALCVICGVPTILVLFALTESTWNTTNPLKIPFRVFKWVMTFRPKSGGVCEVLFFDPLLGLVGLVAGAVVAGFGITLCAMVVLYPVARLYIVFEAFASLRSLPTGSYQSVVWAEMWPHF